MSRGVVLQWLSKPTRQLENDESSGATDETDATWLLVFDNADDLEVLVDYWPVTGAGSFWLPFGIR